MEKHKLDLLVLAAPRSGTRYMTKVLRNAGVHVGHESFKSQGTVGMYFAVEDVFYPGKHWSDENEWRQRRSHYDFKQVWQFTRDPRCVIPSLASDQITSATWFWQERHTGISAGLFPKALRAMLFWVAWNELIEKNEEIDYFFRIEDIDSVWPTICENLGVADTPKVPEIPRNYGTVETGPRKTVPMTWEEMEAVDVEAARAVRDMAERYGYE